MAFIKVGEKESLERAIKRFKKKVEDEGIMQAYRDKQCYRKPSYIRREKRKEAARKYKLKAKQDAKLLAEKETR
ncbi:MAG TPA: 30S ribosomal protein S21 [Candidatus Paceibacterota bacterium]|nr:30S ribosomal protein S21 [Candidatus Paceibacterota bacterium]